MTADVVVLTFGTRPAPRALAELPRVAATEHKAVDAALDASAARRVVVVGSDSDLAMVLTRLLRTARLDVEVAFIPRRRSSATRAYGLPTGRTATRKALATAAQRVPLIRDETGQVLVGAALWVGAASLEKGTRPATLTGEAVADDTVLFDGEVTAVRIEPTLGMPGLRATVLSGRMRPRRWVAGRAAQLGTTGAFVVRDGELSTRTVKRSTFYRHTEGWLAVR